MPDQNAVFKAYDIRGRFPEELDEPLAETIGRAFARFCLLYTSDAADE